MTEYRVSYSIIVANNKTLPEKGYNPDFLNLTHVIHLDQEQASSFSINSMAPGGIFGLIVTHDSAL